MSRKPLIFCLSAIAAIAVLAVAALAFYNRGKAPEVPAQERYSLAYAVPSNAVMVCFLTDASAISSSALSTFEFHGALDGFLRSGNAGSLGMSPMAISMHYSGRLTPLYVFDAGTADVASPEVEALIRFAKEHKYNAEFVNCSDLTQSGPLASRSVVIVAQTKAQLSIAKSHLKEGRSVMDAVGFARAAQSAPANVLFISYDQAKVLYEKAVLRSFYKDRFLKDASSEYSDAASFFHKMAQWGAVSLENEFSFDAAHTFDGDSDFMSVMSHGSPSQSQVSAMLPNYTRFALTLPMADDDVYIEAYSAFRESAKKKAATHGKLMGKLGVTEVATAAFECAGKLEWVNLVKMARTDTMLLRGTGEKAFSNEPKLYPYAFAGSIASAYGKYFRLKDESHFTCMDGWLITGSRTAVEEYVSGMALAYDLKTYMEDAQSDDLFAQKGSSCVVYADFPKGDKWLESLLGTELCEVYYSLKGDAEYAPLVMRVYAKGQAVRTDFACPHLTHVRSRAPKFDRDTVVAVPAGPFKVMNSGTGRTNLFYQRKNGAISLKEEDGRGIWGIPFKKTICGTAHNIDYHANGNLQILFGAGSGIYLIDRSGRYVGGFPVDLGKEILLGPDVYDFNGDNTYTVMVLHKDKTLEMYDLKGRKPEQWKGIKAPEKNTIKSLPELLSVGDVKVWVVRTSMQTLIYPFEGGDPISSFTGDKMFLPTAQMTVKNSSIVEAVCYDGKTRTVKIK